MDSILIEGKNTYATLTNADIYIRIHYQKYAPLRVIWSVLLADEKETYLLNSMAQLESLPVIGRKYSLAQPLQFPRGQNQIPDEVKAAQVENALSIINEECLAQANKQFQTMQALGVMKNIKYSKREVSDAVLGGTITDTAKPKKLSSKKAEELLRPWFGYFKG